MSSQLARTSDFHSPLPMRQFRGFLIFFHVVFLGMLVLSVYGHLNDARLISPFGHTDVRPPHGWADFALIGLVAIQIFLYLRFFALPSVAGRFPGPRIFWAYFMASVALVLAESRINPGFEWALIAYIGQISAMPLRASIPAGIAVFAAFLLNKFGWNKLAAWDGGDWISLLLGATPWFVLILFLGRTVATSGERGRLILELEAAKRELELARERDAELAVLQERERLARELHDSLGHALVTLTVQLEAARRLQGSDPARVTPLLEELQKLTRSSTEDLRRSLANLRAPGLGDRSLTEALQTACAETGKRHGTTVDCRIAQGADSLPRTVAEVLWRVAQEALTNIEKHAQAHQVQLDLALPPGEVVLRVTDDGVGLPANAEEKPGHYGLRGLRERVEGLGGTFTAKAAARGMALEARMPVIA